MLASARRATAVRFIRPLALILGFLAILGPAESQAASPPAAPPYLVCPGGASNGCHFATIQAALDSTATTGQTILVAPGTYRYAAEIAKTGKDATNILSPTILKANGGAVIIECADPFGDSTWTQHSGNVYKASRMASWMTLPLTDGQDFACEVFVDDVRYTFKDTTVYTEAALPAGYWAYDTASQLVYVRLIGGGSPSGRQIFIGDNRRQRGLRIRQSDLFVIDSITIKHASGAGILIEGSSTVGVAKDRLVTVKNCTISHCFKQGMQLSRTALSYVQNNTTYMNGDHGIHIVRSDSISITGNTSYQNDNPLAPRGGKNGIRVGGGSDSTLVADINVDYNRVYENEDTGIELNGARRVVVRRNLSYKNRDHGADNLTSSRTAWINNVIFANDHDGISVENSSKGAAIYNNILLHNARTVATLATQTAEIAELTLEDTTDFKSDHNVIKPLPGKDISGEGDTDDRFVVIVDMPGVSATNFPSFALYRQVTGFDAISDSTLPALDTLSYAFTLNSGTTYAVDAAKSNMTGWRSPMWLNADAAGTVAHNANESDIGVGSPTYGDIGAFEYDPVPGQPAISVAAGRYTYAVTWDERGDDGDLVTAGTHEVFINGGGQGAASAAAPGTPVCAAFEAMDCTPIEVKVKITEIDNGKVVWSNTVNTMTDCAGNQGYSCENGLLAGSGDEESSTISLEDLAGEVDYPLSLSLAGSNPARSLAGVVYGIPKALDGTAFELSMFDIGGRRVAMFGKGAAKAGRRLEPLPSSGAGQIRLAPGVYYLRLIVADKTLTKTVFLVP